LAAGTEISLDVFNFPFQSVGDEAATVIAARTAFEVWVPVEPELATEMPSASGRPPLS
jgi:hypothetical protein